MSCVVWWWRLSLACCATEVEWFKRSKNVVTGLPCAWRERAELSSYSKTVASGLGNKTVHSMHCSQLQALPDLQSSISMMESSSVAPHTIKW